MEGEAILCEFRGGERKWYSLVERGVCEWRWKLAEREEMQLYVDEELYLENITYYPIGLM